MKSRGERSFINFPAFAAKLYDTMMQGDSSLRFYEDIAQDLISNIDRGRLLDVGPGPGRLFIALHKLNTEIDLFGLDVSATMVARAKKNTAGIEVDIRQGNIRATTYEDEFFDLVTCSGSFYLWDHPAEGLEEIYRLLKTGKPALLYETYRDVDEDRLKEQLKVNLSGEHPIRRWLSPYFFKKQLDKTYEEDEIIEILNQTRFAGSHDVQRIVLAGLPVWLRIKLEKKS